MEHNILRWICVMLSNWQTVVAQMGCILRVSRDVCGGTATLFWSLVADGILEQFNRNYADGLALLLSENF
jgi:hypothetical protein